MVMFAINNRNHLGIIGDLKRIGGKNYWKFKKHNRLVLSHNIKKVDKKLKN